MIQMIITYIIVAAAFGKVAWVLYREITKKEGSFGCSSGCGGCGTPTPDSMKKTFTSKHKPSIAKINITKMA